MGQKTGKIRYNVNERGRQHRGKDRNFDLRALQSLVNSPAIQERVRNRDMVGYYGHWQRVKFGVIPPETVILDGKSVNIDPAIVTTYLSADSDGNIEHEAEFLDTPSGRIAERLYASKTGGFSSAIDATTRGNFHVPTSFAGFDYVLEPNYTTNRGYLFDSANMETEDQDKFVLLDSVMHSNHALTAMNVLYDSLQNDHMLAMQTIQRLMEENEDLLSMHARNGTILDSVGAPGVRPMLASKSATAEFQRRAAAFNAATLPAFEKLPEEREREEAGMDAVHRHYGISK